MIDKYRGFSLVELIVALALLVLLVTGIAPLLFQSARMNRSKQLVIETQANARSCVSLITQRLRTQRLGPAGGGHPAADAGDDREWRNKRGPDLRRPQRGQRRQRP